MKVLFIPFLLLTLNAFGQKTPAKTKTTTSKEKPTSVQPKAETPVPPIPKLSKRMIKDSTEYALSDSVKIKNGKEEKVTVYFTAIVPVDVWDDYVARYNNKEKELFSLIVSILSTNAQYTLKNTLSFEPFSSQFFMYYKKDKMFMCSYKMMGRNGYGNLVETSELVRYDVVPKLK